MACGGFVCSRNALCALNVVYALVGALLIAVAAWGKGLGVVSSPPLIAGGIAVGALLLLLAALGLLGAARHHQVLLFFYMVILGLVFIVQFGLSCSCLAMGRTRQRCATLQGRDPPPCLGCAEKLLRRWARALRLLGGVGLFFSFTEILGVWLAMRYRNQKDPRAHPSAFL
ncbi:tetraspanin-31 [Rhynochetos jubatus]